MRGRVACRPVKTKCRVFERHPPHDSVNFIGLMKKELGEVRTVLPRIPVISAFLIGSLSQSLP
jgi:hypothetical protein